MDKSVGQNSTRRPSLRLEKTDSADEEAMGRTSESGLLQTIETVEVWAHYDEGHARDDDF